MLSVVIPIGNLARDFYNLTDIIKQSCLADVELIFVLDTDEEKANVKLRNLCKAEHQAKFSVFKCSERNPGASRNIGITNATGEWIAFCDSDDVWAVDRLHTQVKQRSDETRAMCSNAWIDNGVDEMMLMFESPPDTLRLQDLLKSNQIVNSSVLVERSLLKEVGGIPMSPNLRGLEDYATWLRISAITDFQFVSDPLITYKDNSTGSIRSEQEFSRIQNQTYAWIDFLAWMRARGLPLDKSETQISIKLPKLIAKEARKYLN
jgi:glycosyltransferase involved in cell wall biosynthesis